MATIGLDMLHYAKITEDENGNESYGTPQKLAKAMSADLSVELAEATLYADDGAAEIVKENYFELFYPTETEWREKTVEDFAKACKGVLDAKLIP